MDISAHVSPSIRRPYHPSLCRLASGSEDEEAASRAVSKPEVEERAHPAPRRTSVASSRQTSRETRAPAKRQPRRRPQLDPPKTNAGPMILSSSELEGSKTLEVCANLNNYIFDYQRGGVKFLFGAYERDTEAILGDNMGLGKTIQVIAFLSGVEEAPGEDAHLQSKYSDA
ncbi:DNA excision repair protein ERCC-6-like 2 [Phytophthora pseudosyringae]|uniref:DNA excision repair protein ERCC-6-like 2 n=1 Tax=Phytophthora pseudosyringae TaxID=221518 RepID=A0A8T1W852_9STRA|nr:DNA excision repair protein ERCC-6-like 2 [Phytophthora pseudosyringae]